MHAHTLAPCNDCNRRTRHDIVHTILEGGLPKFQTIQCRGCDAVALREIRGGGKIKKIAIYHPPRTIVSSRLWPGWAGLLSVLGAPEAEKFDDLIFEIYKAGEHGFYRLAVMGLRSVIEQMMIIKVGDKGKFWKTLREFADAGYISLLQHDQLSTILEAGHAVTHRAYTPTKQDLNTALAVMEGIVETIYVNDSQVKDMEGRIPRRIQS
jgi:uncharacterized protein DUF4145